MAAFIRLSADCVEIAPEQVVLSPDDVALRVDAQQVLAEAKAQAAQMKAEAQAVFEAEKRRGYKEGREEASAELSEQLLNVVSRSVDYLAQAEGEVAKTVSLCLRKILGDAPEEEVVVQTARHALSAVANETRVTLVVSPQVSEEVRARVDDIRQGNTAIQYLEIASDPTMQRGDCRLETDLGVVDASIELQISALERVLAKRASTEV